MLLSGQSRTLIFSGKPLAQSSWASDSRSTGKNELYTRNKQGADNIGCIDELSQINESACLKFLHHRKCTNFQEMLA